jgi:quercetin dioxygenase-like cupin family protein
MSRFVRHFRPLVLSLAVSLAAAPIARAEASAPAPAVSALLTKALTDYPAKEVLIIQVDYAPGLVETVHRHDAHAFVYVLEGSIVMGVKGGKEQTLTAGQIFYEGPQDLHTVGRNASKTKPAKFIVFLLKDKNKPAVIPVTHP